MVIRTPELSMAVAGIGGAMSKSPFISLRRPLSLCCALRRRSSAAAVVESPPDTLSSAPPPPSLSTASVINGGSNEGIEGPKWKMVNSKELEIKSSMISRPTRSVLKELKKKGFEVYLVGGCVRDLIMKRTPKDFDIITTADLKQVQRTFTRCMIVGRRFPICHVYINDSIVEVSSFSTSAQKANSKLSYFTRSPDCDEHDFLRWRNCLCRDFTINGLMFNPFSNVIYDYLGGMEDIKKAKVRTVIPSYTSFQEDCARILRAIRIAARLGFSFSRETAYSVKDLASSVLRLDKSRILMEMNYMLAYGSAEASLRLLWKFGLLELLLPIQAAYFVSSGFRRRDKRTNMLLALFANLDRLLAPNRPCHSCLWIGLLAFHEALARNPRDPLVIATFTLALHNGGNMAEAVDIARRITHPHDPNFPELSGSFWRDSDEFDEDELEREVMDLVADVGSALSSMTDEFFVSRAMEKYREAPKSDLVFIPLQSYLKVCRMFDCIRDKERDRGFVPKRGSNINYFNLSHGGLADVRYVFARVVFDTVFPPNLDQFHDNNDNNNNNNSKDDDDDDDHAGDCDDDESSRVPPN